MALQIGNPRIIRLVTEVSEGIGEDAEAVIEIALLERLPTTSRAAGEDISMRTTKHAGSGWTR